MQPKKYNIDLSVIINGFPEDPIELDPFNSIYLPDFGSASTRWNLSQLISSH